MVNFKIIRIEFEISFFYYLIQKIYFFIQTIKYYHKFMYNHKKYNKYFKIILKKDSITHKRINLKKKKRKYIYLKNMFIIIISLHFEIS